MMVRGKVPTVREFSAGGVVYRKVPTEEGKLRVEFVIGKHSGYHKWVLPKGLVEKGEEAMETAVREVEEEVGVRARIVDMAPLGTVEYFYFADMEKVFGKGANEEITERRVKKYQEEGGKNIRVHKRVVFYLMESEEDLGKEGWEMEERKWVSWKEGLQLLAFEGEKEILQKAGEALGLGASSRN